MECRGQLDAAVRGHASSHSRATCTCMIPSCPTAVPQLPHGAHWTAVWRSCKQQCACTLLKQENTRIQQADLQNQPFHEQGGIDQTCSLVLLQ